FKQPGFIEARTLLAVEAAHNYGPDPYEHFTRQLIDGEVGLSRWFWSSRLFSRLAIHHHLALVPPGETLFDGSETPTSSALTVMDHLVRLELRTDGDPPAQAMVQLSTQQAGYFLPSHWDYFRVLPEVRGHLPLGWGLSLAARFALGMLFITDADEGLDR